MTRRAFTLLELLAVITIIALLLGVLLPGLGQSKRSAADGHCLDSLHQIAVEVAMYHLAHDRWPISETDLDDPTLVWRCQRAPDRYEVGEGHTLINDGTLTLGSRGDFAPWNKIAVAGDCTPWFGYRNMGYLDGHAGREGK